MTKNLGFSKASAYQAFMKMNRACASNCHCTPLCQLYMAKEILSESMQSGEKVSANLPKDIFEMYQSLPILPERYSQMDLHEAFEAVQNICDNCPDELHGKYCIVNVVLTALGTLVYGKEFVTEKDIKSQNLS
jgi:hypothetical protein